MINSSIFDEITAACLYKRGHIVETFEGDFEELQYRDDADNIKVEAFGNEYTLNEFVQFAEEVEKSGLDADVFAAYISNTGCDLGSAVSEAEEAFAGEFANDRDFAEDMADQLGMEKDVNWPYTCIDWEQAAKELMYDYFSENGYYFRNL